jgi:hypothetical protein
MELFSRKHKLQRPSVGLVYEDIPLGVRRSLLNFLSKRIGMENLNQWMLIQEAIFEAPQVRRDFQFRSYSPLSIGNIDDVVERCKWYSFLDICQLLARLFDSDDWKRSEIYSTDKKTSIQIFEETINEIFTDNCIGYELKNGKVEKLGAPYIDKLITQVRQVLQKSEYHGPNEQFEKAIGFLNQRPNPDTANCVKDAIGAVEGLARIISGNNKLVLNKILDSEPFRSEIHGALREMMQKLYAYRGDAEGAGHGQTSTCQISIEEAELTLGTSASCMIYLAKKFGKEP